MVAEQGLEVSKPLTMVIKYWESLCKSKRPKNTSYEILVKHRKDHLVPTKLQFFAFVASIFQPYFVIFQTNSPMIPYVFRELEKIFNQLIRLYVGKMLLTRLAQFQRKLRKSGLQIKIIT